MDASAETRASPHISAMQNDLTEGSVNTLSLAFAEGLYADYLKDPSLVPQDWQEYFATLVPDAGFSRSPKLGPTFRAQSLFNAPPGNGHSAPAPNPLGATVCRRLQCVRIASTR